MILLLTIIFLALGVVALWAFVGHGGDPFDNIIPEIFGFCLDAAILVFLVNYIQERQAFKQKRQAKRHVISILNRFSEEMFYWKGGKWNIITRDEIENKKIDVMTEMTKLDADLLKEFMAIVATFSSDHLRDWAQMLSHLEAAKISNDQGHIDQFYEHAKKFINREVEK